MVPAYGRELVELRNAGKKPAQPVYVCDDWTICRMVRERDRYALMVEDPKRPLDYLVLTGLDVVVMHRYGLGPLIRRNVRAVQPKSLVYIAQYAYTDGHFVEHAIAEAERRDCSVCAAEWQRLIAFAERHGIPIPKA